MYVLSRIIRISKYIIVGAISFVVIMVALSVMFLGGFGGYDEGNASEPMVFAHRGLSNYYAENSSEGFDALDSIGIGAVEIDIELTKDNHLIVFHDSNCERLLGIDTSIREVDLKFIKNRNLIYNNNHTGNKVLTLDEFFSHYGTKRKIYLDVKVANRDVADSLIVLFEKYNLYNTAIVADAKFEFLSYIKLKNQNIKTVLEGFGSGKEWIYYIMPKRIKPDYFSGFFSNVDNQFISFLRENNLLNRFIPYDVKESDIKKSLEYGLINCIITYHYEYGNEHTLKKYQDAINRDRSGDAITIKM
jgi:glycerophosphoryl diester phosphodiesterase